jgi:general secretion pathway protein N
MGWRLAKILLVAVLGLYFLFLLLAQAPAAWGVWALHRAVPDVRLTGVSGTIWDGRAVGGTIAAGQKLVPVDDLRWQVNPWALMSLNACATVEAQVVNQPASGAVCAAPGNVIHAHNVQLSAPMALVGDWFNVNVGGLASLQLQELRLKEQSVLELEGNLSWRDARWRDGERSYSLGAFAAKLTENPQGGVHADIFELDGPFKVDLSADFVIGQEPVVQGTVNPSPKAPAPIREAIQFVGEPIEGGGFRLAWPPGT